MTPGDDRSMRHGSVSVVIPSLGRPTLARLVAGLAGHPAVAEILVVDDRDAPSAPLLDPAGPARLIRGDARGPPAARHRGARCATAEVLLVLDDDVTVPGDLATGHAAHHARERGLVVIGAMPLVAPPPLSTTQSLYRDDYAKWSARARADAGYALRRLWGGHFSIRRDDALAIGLENPAFHGYRHEDLELGLRLAAAGLRGRFDPSLRVDHRYERTAEQLLRDSHAQGEEWVRLRALHPEADLAPPRQRYGAGLPGPLRVLVELMSRPRAITASRRVLATARRLARSLRGERTYQRVLQMSRRVEQLHGASSQERRNGLRVRTPGDGG